MPNSSTSLTLFHSPGTRSVRVLWLLEEMQLTYALKSLKYNSKYFASDEFRTINPMGKVPALYDDGSLIIESTAIMEYLLQRYGPSELSLSPQDPEYATYLQWFHMAESGMAHYIAVSLGQLSGKDRYAVSEDFDNYCRFQITKALDMLEMHLQDRDYLLKRRFSAADISLGYTLFLAKSFTVSEFSKNIEAYYDRIMSRPAAKVAVLAQADQETYQ